MKHIKTSNLGDMYSKFYTIGLEDGRDDIAELTEQTINLIYNDIKNTKEIEDCNNKLDVFHTILGDGNVLGLRSHPKIYMRKKKPAYEFHMRY